MTDRFKNKYFNKDATSYLQQAPDWNIFLVQSIFLKKKKKRPYFHHHHHHSSLAETAVNSYTSLLIYFEVQGLGSNSPTLHSSL